MPMQSRETIAQIVEANDIVDVIGSYFPLTRAGSDYKARSPFTNEKTPSFYVSPGKQAWYCWSSQQGGDVIKFVRQYENLSFGEALKKLAERANITLHEGEMTPEMEAEAKRRRGLREVHVRIADWYHRLLMRSRSAADAREYLKARELDSEIARSWKLGYAPETNDALFTWAERESFDPRLLLDAGLLRQRDGGGSMWAHFRHRLMFPINNDYGEPIAFSGRVLSKDQPGGKYVNSPETPLFQKSKIFFGLDKSKRAILNKGYAILCEGQLDLIRCYESGFENVVAPLGTAFTQAHAAILRRHTEEVIICLDADRAGLKATNNVFEELARTGATVKVARMPDGEDPDTLIRGQGPEAYGKVIEEAADYFDFLISLSLDDPQGSGIRERAELAHTLAGRAALMPDEIKRGFILDRIGSRLGIATEELRRASVEESRKRIREERRTRPEENTTGPRPAMLPESNAMSTFCRLLLTSGEARDWLQENGQKIILRDVPDSALLEAIWDGEMDPSNPSSVSGFVATLSDDAQQAASRLLMEKGPDGGAGLSEACYRAVQRKALQTRIESAKARLRDPSLPPETVVALQEEMLDLSRQLRDVPAASAGPTAQPR